MQCNLLSLPEILESLCLKYVRTVCSYLEGSYWYHPEFFPEWWIFNFDVGWSEEHYHDALSPLHIQCCAKEHRLHTTIFAEIAFVRSSRHILSRLFCPGAQQHVNSRCCWHLKCSYGNITQNSSPNYEFWIFFWIEIVIYSRKVMYIVISTYQQLTWVTWTLLI